MLKKILITCGIFICSLSIAQAGIYVSGLAAYHRIHADDIKDKTLFYRSVIPQLSLGYGQPLWDWAYLGAEIFGSIGAIPASGSNDTILRSDYSYGVSINPGLALDTFLLGYLRFGALNVHFDNMNKTDRAYIAGAGVRYMFGTCWGVVGEYDHLWYRPIENPDLTSPRAEILGIGIVFDFS